jgi:biotin carboxyl carrier protein
MPGVVVQILVRVGDTVQEDDELLLMEAVKMEVPVVAPRGGCVQEIRVCEQERVAANQVIIVLG